MHTIARVFECWIASSLLFGTVWSLFSACYAKRDDDLVQFNG